MARKVILLFFFVYVCFLITPLMAQTPFYRMDRNSDQQLSRSEFKGPPVAFRELDKNNDGYVTRKEAVNTPLLGGMVQSRPREGRSPKKESRELIYVDTHNHLVSHRVTGQFNFNKPAQIAIESMNASG